VPFRPRQISAVRPLSNTPPPQESQFDSIQLLKQFGFEPDDLSKLGFVEEEVIAAEEHTGNSSELKYMIENFKHSIDVSSLSNPSDIVSLHSFIDKLASDQIGQGLIKNGEFTSEELTRISLDLIEGRTYNPEFEVIMKTPLMKGIQDRWKITKMHILKNSSENAIICAFAPAGIIDFHEFNSLNLLNYIVHVVYRSEEDRLREKKLAAKFGLFQQTEFHLRGELGNRFENHFDLLVTSDKELGDESEWISSLRNLLEYIRPGGYLLINAFTHPSLHNTEGFSDEDKQNNMTLFQIFKFRAVSCGDFLGVLEDAGFIGVQVIEGPVGSNPIFLAQKKKPVEDEKKE